MNTIPYNFGIAALSRLLIGGISLIIVGILTRNLGPDGYGHYSLIFAYVYIFTALADFGLYTILVREISKSGADEKRILSNVFSLRLTVSLVLITLGILLALFLPYPKEVKVGITAASLFAVLTSLYQILAGVFQKYLKLYYVSIADVVARLAQLALILLVLSRRPTLMAFVWIVVISELVHFLLILVFTQKLVKLKMAYEPKYWSAIVRSSLPIAISLVFTLLYFKMDTVLLSLLKPARDVGIYSVAYKILEVVIFLPAVYTGLLMPALSRQAFESRSEFVKTFRKGFNTLAIFAMPAIAYLFLRAEDIIRIMGGEQFEASVTVLKILSAAIMLIFFGNLGGNALAALDLQKKGVGIYFAGAVLNVGANLVFIPAYSYLAAAWTTVLTELLITVGIFWLIKKETQTVPEAGVAAKAALAAIITGLVLHPWHLNFGLATLAALIYFPILFILGGFNRRDLRELVSLRATK